MSRRVVLIQKTIPPYRREFFDLLRARLSRENVFLEVLASRGDFDSETRVRNDLAPWMTGVTSLSVRSLGGLWLYQNLSRHLDPADLIIVGQENRVISNYLIHLRQASGAYKIAGWTHGANFNQGNSFAELLRGFILRRLDWLFAYTELSKRHLLRHGIPAGRITVVNNTSPNAALEGALTSESPRQETRARLLARLGWDPESKVGVFCGTLHRGKNLQFLLAAAGEIKEQIPGFRLLIIGGGPLQGEILRFARTHPWCHSCGDVRGRERDLLLGSGDILLNPYFLGLVIVDAFRAGLPVVTVRAGNHSPEVAYLEEGVTGLLTEPDVHQYARAIIELLRSSRALREMKTAALRAGEKYPLQFMVERFADGILACLGPDEDVSPVGSAECSVSERRRTVKLLIIHPALAPYRIDLFNELAQRYELKIVFLNKEINYHKDLRTPKLYRALRCDYQILTRNRRVAGRDFPLGLDSLISAWHPDVVVTSEFSFPTLSVSRLARKAVRPFGHVVWSDDNLHVTQQRRVIPGVLRRFLARRADSILLPSHRSKTAFGDKFGIPAGKIFICTVQGDGKRQAQRLAKLNTEALSLLERHGLAGVPVILYVGRLSAEKNVAHLIQAYGRVMRELGRCALVIVGSGTERNSLQRMAEELGEGKLVRFTGYADGDAVLAWYKLASVLVLPSLVEPYGAVIGEALSAGVRVICSSYAGAMSLVEEGKTGITFSPDHPTQLENALVEAKAKGWLTPPCPTSERVPLQKRTLQHDLADFSAAVDSAVRPEGGAR